MLGDLIDAALSLADWQRFGRVHGERLVGDAPVYMPWLLDGADLASLVGPIVGAALYAALAARRRPAVLAEVAPAVPAMTAD